jgi:hypothetical protein
MLGLGQARHHGVAADLPTPDAPPQDEMKTALALTAALLLAGCHAMVATGGHATHPAATAVPVVADDVRLKALETADWARAIPIGIVLRDQGFTPDVIRLVRGQAYRLTVENIGGNSHYLNAPEFLRSIAVRHVEVRGEVEIEAPVFSRFEVAPRGGRFQIDFVPLVRGEYHAHCHLEGNAHIGVDGKFIVE